MFAFGMTNQKQKHWWSPKYYGFIYGLRQKMGGRYGVSKRLEDREPGG